MSGSPVGGRRIRQQHDAFGDHLNVDVANADNGPGALDKVVDHLVAVPAAAGGTDLDEVPVQQGADGGPVRPHVGTEEPQFELDDSVKFSAHQGQEGRPPGVELTPQTSTP